MSETIDNKPIPRFSTQLSDNRKPSLEPKPDPSIPRFVQYSDYKSKYSNSTDSYNKKGDGQNFKIGYGSLSDQMCKRAYRKGFEFNMMVVGSSGLGKSTFVNSLLLSDFYNAENLGPSKRIKKTVCVEPITVIMKEKDVVLKLCLIDTPGFGDAVDNSACWEPILQCIDNRFDDFMKSEIKINRNNIVDKRVHACIYFIQPNGHGLKALDVEFMKRIHEKVNLIPVIGKSDTMTSDECRDFKKTISNQLTFHKIKIYDFPESGASYIGDISDPTTIDVKKCRDKLPFAVVGSNLMIEKNGKKVRGRRYPWGDVEVENMDHNDFVFLRYLLMRTHFQDLKDVTGNVLYERYRDAKLTKYAEDSNFTVIDGKDPMFQLEAEKLDQESRIRKMEEEMRVLFEQKAEERAAKLRETESEIEKRNDQMRQQLEHQLKEYEDQKNQFEMEKLHWEESHREFELEHDLRSSSERLESKQSKSKRKTLF